ncbi:MAG: hypothetical protein Q7S28_00420 [bacterium]|nr:hypothetical protein [bacterium]
MAEPLADGFCTSRTVGKASEEFEPPTSGQRIELETQIKNQNPRVSKKRFQEFLRGKEKPSEGSQEITYCYECGAQMSFSLYPAGFDTKTGEKHFELRDLCMNVACRKGCKNNGGHRESKKFFHHNECDRCGAVCINGND